MFQKMGPGQADILSGILFQKNLHRIAQVSLAYVFSTEFSLENYSLQVIREAQNREGCKEYRTAVGSVICCICGQHSLCISGSATK
jgi:hypothetical protein